jgi:hypothetical protein
MEKELAFYEKTIFASMGWSRGRFSNFLSDRRTKNVPPLFSDSSIPLMESAGLRN